jgi:hypothetical protein
MCGYWARLRLSYLGRLHHAVAMHVYAGRHGQAFVVRSEGRSDAASGGEAMLPTGWQAASACWCPVLTAHQLQLLVELPPSPYMPPAVEGAAQDKVALQPYF